MPIQQLLLSKSDQNKSSAELLIENDKYAASIHCSYYSSIQVILHLIEVNKDDFETLRIDINKPLAKRKRRGKHLGIHQIYFEFLKSVICDEETRYDTLNDLEKLKLYRKRSDYENRNIEKELAQEALDLSKKINLLLNTLY